MGSTAHPATAAKQFICEYAGELITREAANRRTQYRRENGLRGDYIYHFRHPTTGENMCFDATEETKLKV